MSLIKPFSIFFVGALALVPFTSAKGAPVPGYVPPVSMTGASAYADDTRGVFVPSHDQHRLRTREEMVNYNNYNFDNGNTPLYAQANPQTDVYERRLNSLSYGGDVNQEMERIAGDPGVINAPQMQRGRALAGVDDYFPPAGQAPAPRPYAAPQAAAPSFGGGYQPQVADNYAMQPSAVPGYGRALSGEGIEIAVGSVTPKSLDMVNSLVRLQEDRITVRRALQRMMDQIGGGDWTVVWDLAEQNAGLPEMEISLYAEEPFMNVLNALLARIQTRSGQPLRVIRYEKTQRMIVTDRVGGHRLSGHSSPLGVEGSGVAVTEQVLKESMISLHYDEIPLVDALESIINQGGKGEWRLRVYAGLDQVLKPAHIEEPFGIAMERVLRLFNLKYEIFPGGKLVVVTHDNKFGFGG